MGSRQYEYRAVTQVSSSQTKAVPIASYEFHQPRRTEEYRQVS